MLVLVVLRLHLSALPASRDVLPADVAGWPGAAAGSSSDSVVWEAVPSELLVAPAAMPGVPGPCTLGQTEA